MSAGKAKKSEKRTVLVKANAKPKSKTTKSSANKANTNKSSATKAKSTKPRVTKAKLKSPTKSKRKSSLKTKTNSAANLTGGKSVRSAKKPDDLKRIEGIGPKIENLMHADGVKTFSKMSKTSVKRLRTILEKGGPRFVMHNPDTWPEQAGLAALGEWTKLDQLQDRLNGGRPNKKSKADSTKRKQKA